MDDPQRKRTRLAEYDYATPGAYFITICTHEKKCLFGKIVSVPNFGEPYMEYSPMGEIARKCLLDIESHYDNVKIDNWVIMPNHVHMLVQITERINPFPTIAFDISNVIGKYKAAVTRTVGNAFMHSGKVWQASFHDHVIRSEEDYLKIWQYIGENPSKWLEDRYYCENERNG